MKLYKVFILFLVFGFLLYAKNLDLVNHYIDDRQNNESAKLAEKTINSIASGKYSGIREEAKTHFVNLDIEKAINSLTKKRKASNYENALNLLLLGDLKVVQFEFDEAKKNYDEAILKLRRAVSVDSRNYRIDLINALVKYGFFLYSTENLDLAENYYREALNDYKGLELAIPGKYQNAIAQLNLLLSEVAVKKERPYQAVENLEQAKNIYLDLLPTSKWKYYYLLSEVFFKLGNVYRDEGNKKALENYKKALNYVNILLKQIEKIRQQSKKKNVNYNYGNVSYLDRKSDIYNSLGIFYKKRQDLQKAIFYYRKSYAIKKLLFKKYPEFFLDDYGGVLYNLGLLYDAGKDYEKALTYYEEAHNIFQNSKKSSFARKNLAMIYHNLGFLYKKIKDYKNAVLYLEKTMGFKRNVAYKNMGDNFYLAILDYGLGESYMMLGENDKAVNYLKRAYHFYYVQFILMKRQEKSYFEAYEKISKFLEELGVDIQTFNEEIQNEIITILPDQE